MAQAPRTTLDVSALLDHGSWSSYPRAITLLAALAVIFDGFDIQILGFAIPSILREWNLTRGDFAPVLAIGLAGMTLGSVLAGYCGDRFGRRVTLIACVLLFGGATIATAVCRNLTELTILRFLTGMGAGGALPNVGALAAEFAPLRRRPVAVTLTMICVPLGGMGGGLLAARILPTFGWRTLYAVGGGAPVLFALILWWTLPESPRFLARHPRRWPDLTRLLRRMGHAVEDGTAFEDRVEQRAESQTALKIILGREHLRDTAGLWIAFFACMHGIYLVFGWLPAMLSAQGMGLAASSSGLAAYNFGGVFGILLWAAAATFFGSRAPLLAAALAAAGSAFAIQFAPLRSAESQPLLIAGFGLHGLFVNALQTTMYVLAAHVYPTKTRASGVAFAAAVGRVGAMVSSFTGAAIIQSGGSNYLRVLAISMFCAFLGLLLVSTHFPGHRRQ
ncbi:MAG TPA: MFS transporter [Bryobacteraceae bacterium]|nr:MFS transporter [Bryobacteraceae bacterium]